MRTIKLKKSPKGHILSNDELKSIMGGIRREIECKCWGNLSTGKSVAIGVGPSGLDSNSACKVACIAACSSYFVSSTDPKLYDDITCKSVSGYEYIVREYDF